MVVCGLFAWSLNPVRWAQADKDRFLQTNTHTEKYWQHTIKMEYLQAQSDPVLILEKIILFEYCLPYPCAVQ